MAEESFWKPEVVADEWKPKLEPEEWRPEQDEVEDESSDSEVEEILSISPELKIRDVDDDDSFQFRSVFFRFCVTLRFSIDGAIRTFHFLCLF